MSRFKEQRRIEQAINHKNQEELEWALSYSRLRLKTASMKHHEKHWRKIEKEVLLALEQARE